MPSTVAVVLINYNNESYTIPCLDSLEPQASDDVEVIVVDNGSSRDSYEAVREAHEWPTYIRLEENRGSPAATTRRSTTHSTPGRSGFSC